MKKVVFFALIIIAFIACKEQQFGADGFLANSSHDALLKSNFHNFIEYAWNNSNTDSLKPLMEEDFVKYLNGIPIAENKSEMAANMNIYFKGFPDGKVSVVDVTVKGDDLFAQWVYTGTNTGIFGEFPPTGKKVNVQGYTHIEFSNSGKMIREVVYYNELEMLQQLGYTLNPPVLE